MEVKFKKNFRPGGPGMYYYEFERKEGFHKSIYDHLLWLEEITNFELTTLDDESKLEHLSKEISVRLRIGKRQIFKIGEILTKAKKICQESKTNFKQWIELNCDFSYETAHNYMNVYKYCLSFERIAEEIPDSILYRLSSPSFDEELREYLLMSGSLIEISGGKFKHIVDKFHEGGIEAVEKEVEEFGTAHLFYRQVNYTLDIAESALRSLIDFKRKIECRGGSNKGIVEFEVQAESMLPESCEVNIKLYEAVETAIKILDECLSESRKQIDKYADLIKEKM